MKILTKFTLFFSLAFLFTPAYSSLSTGIVNDFQTGTVEGWSHIRANPQSPVVTLNDGPTGVGDTSLWISASGGNGAGSRLLAVNRNSPWTGSTAAEITGLEMDLKHVNANDLSIRIAISNTTGSAGTWWVSQTAYSLNTANSGNWEHASFAFSDMSQVQGADSLANVLANIAEVRILHNTNLNFRGGSVNGVFAVDNISAIPVPGAVWLFGTAVFWLTGYRSSRQLATNKFFQF